MEKTLSLADPGTMSHGHYTALGDQSHVSLGFWVTYNAGLGRQNHIHLYDIYI